MGTAMLVSAPGGLTASAAMERNYGNVLESADYADYADKENEKLEQEAGGAHRRRTPEQTPHRFCAPAPALSLRNLRNLWMQTF